MSVWAEQLFGIVRLCVCVVLCTGEDSEGSGVRLVSRRRGNSKARVSARVMSHAPWVSGVKVHCVEVWGGTGLAVLLLDKHTHT